MILGVGHYVPPLVVTNAELERTGTTDKWIYENVGIKERRVALYNESSDMGALAGVDALHMAHVDPKDIGMVIVATATPDKLSPSTACIVKKLIRLQNAVAFDISAVCSGFLFGLSVAHKYLDDYKYILVIGVDAFSTITDWNRRDCVFFGDGAGAAVLTKGDHFKGFALYSDYMDKVGFYCDHNSKFTMNAKDVYNTAVRVLPIAINGVLEKCNMSINDIDYLIPHQPSKRILLDVADKIGIPRDKVLMNMEKYGNTVAGTIPILLSESWSKFKKGDKLLFAAIGSGWTYGSAIYEV